MRTVMEMTKQPVEDAGVLEQIVKVAKEAQNEQLSS